MAIFNFFFAYIQFSDIQVSDDTETKAFLNNDINESSLFYATDIIEELETNNIASKHIKSVVSR